MVNTTENLTNVNLLSKEQYDSVTSPSAEELWAVETPTVVETYAGGNGNWYRIYSDGWVEQGGTFGRAFSSYTEKAITLLKPFDNVYYNITAIGSHTSALGECPTVKTKTNTRFSVIVYNSQGFASWYACGQGE